jgi:hypothetical protein
VRSQFAAAYKTSSINNSANYTYINYIMQILDGKCCKGANSHAKYINFSF